MDIKKIIKLIIPPIFLKIREALKPRRIIKSPLPKVEHVHERMVIIGNGPSLNDSIAKYKDEMLACDLMAVNFFASTDLYEELKPKYYVFADPAWFNTPQNLTQSMGTMFDKMIKVTDWPLEVVIPLSAKGAPMEQKLLSNKNIKINYYFNGYQDVGKMSKFEAWDRNLIAPPAQNVLNVSIYLSLLWEYPETYIIGADSSFLEDIRVDQETNEVFTMDKHFYEHNKVYRDKGLYDSKKGRSWGDKSLSCRLKDFVIAFGNYEELQRYANYKGLKVYNASEYSWIDAFKRKKLE